jgi:hypothetical protein
MPGGKLWAVDVVVSVDLLHLRGERCFSMMKNWMDAVEDNWNPDSVSWTRTIMITFERPVRPESLSLYQWKDLVYVSQISSENGLHSNFISIFRSDRFEAQTFCFPFNNLTVLTVLMESAL